MTIPFVVAPFSSLTTPRSCAVCLKSASFWQWAMDAAGKKVNRSARRPLCMVHHQEPLRK